MRTFGRYLKLIGVFAKYSLMSSLEYRINFVTGMTVEMGWMIIKLFYVAIIYKAGTNIGILTPHHILLFIGTYVLMTGIYMYYHTMETKNVDYGSALAVLIVVLGIVLSKIVNSIFREKDY